MADNSLPGRFHVQIDGAELPIEASGALLEITVETSLLLPSVATLLLDDPNLLWIDDDRLTCGKAVTIFAALASDSDKPLFDGEIVEVEPDLTPASKRLTIRAFDRLHRLSRGRQVRSFQNLTDGDLMTQIAREAGLTPDIDTTAQVHEYLLQSNQTNLELLRQRASALGYFLYVDGKTLFCKSIKNSGASLPPIELTWNSGLSEFRPRLSTIAQVDEVMVRGWDPKERKEIIGLAKPASDGAPQTEKQEIGSTVARQAFSITARHLVTDRTVRSQTEADVLARATAERLTGQFIEADGACSGGATAALRAGQRLTIGAIGQRFGGTYTVTSATHHYTPQEGHTTRFSVSGQQAHGILELLGNTSQNLAATQGLSLAVGIVTDNNDPLQMGRVKVRFPWLSSEHTSDWSRIASPGAGPDRGLLCLPEINDEVLVGFEQGDIHQTYILGGLWNGKDKPPKGSQGDLVTSGGSVEERIWVSRSGHQIALVDKDGKESILIRDKNGNEIVLDSSKNELRCTVQGEAKIQAQGKLTLESQGGAVEIKGTAGVTVDGGGGEAVIKGTMIRLN